MERSTFTTNSHRFCVPVFVVGLITSIGGYSFFAYSANRSESVSLIAVYTLLFAAYLAFIWLSKIPAWVNILLGVSIGLRAVFIFSEPKLSDDVYRFLWDGALSINGINPFYYLPSQIMNGAVPLNFQPNAELFALMNSPNYHTVYPPICQAIFALSALVFPQNIFLGIVMIRLCLFAAEIRSLFLIKALLAANGKPSAWVLLYALNPLIILELTGNLHFEALMLMLLLEFLTRWQKGLYNQAAIFMGLAVATKLLPLIFLPLLLRRLELKKLTVFYLIVTSVTLVLMLPLLSASFVEGLSSSIRLYFQTFEFNASVYYIARAIGYWYIGWNMISFNGKLMAVLTFFAIMIYALTNSKPGKAFEQNMLFTWFLYLIFALTVHPWYVTPTILFAALTRFRFPVVWSYFAFLTYVGYYNGGFNESLVVVAVEYTVVFAYLIYELVKSKTGTTQSNVVPGASNL
ncbi:MAG: glycosyltransferase 87 family protein [Sumerlaeia bacterium]